MSNLEIFGFFYHLMIEFNEYKENDFQNEKIMNDGIKKQKENEIECKNIKLNSLRLPNFDLDFLIFQRN